MSAPVSRARPLPWPWIALALALFLLAGAAWALVRQQLTSTLDAAQGGARRELTLIASILGGALQQGDYQDVERLLHDWGTRNTDLVELELVAANGFTLGQFQRATGAQYILALDTPIEYSYQRNATLRLRMDLQAAYAYRDRLAAQLATAFAVIGTLLGYLVTALQQRRREIAQRRRTEEALFEAKERAEVTLHSIGDAVITTDATGRVEYMNPIAEKLTGWTTDTARGQPLTTAFKIENERTRAPAPNPVERVLREGIIVGLANHTVLIARDGHETAIEDSAAPIRNRAGGIIGVVLVFHDVTASRELTNQLNWQASHDPLTGLINRREFENRLARALGSAHTEGAQHALLYLDLDQFKVVNDTCGHTAGDELLKRLAMLKQGQMRASDTLARLGGDEFGVVLEHCPLEQAERIAEELQEVTRAFRFVWEGRSFDVGVSIGLVPIHAESGTLANVMAAADMACYAAKDAGRNRIHVYRDSDAALAQRHGEMLWVSRLGAALEQDRFLLYRQAIVPATGDAHPVHYEVLLRLHDEDRNIILPAAFLPAAERYNLMPAIDRWVVHRVLARGAWHADGDGQMVAINVSGTSIGDPQFLEFIRRELERHPGAATRLCFEITETAAVTNLERALRFMEELRALGCRFALDDFGAGLSSFGYLKNLPVDFLKIDGGLVRHVAANPVDHAMVQAINDIGHTMGMRTIAEFVEDEAIRAALLGIGVDFLQGYAIERPRPLEF